MHQLEKEVSEFSLRNRLFEGADRVLLAVSGGADSVAAAHILRRMRQERVLDGELKVQPVIGHVNHKLRGRFSDGDEEFVRKLACQLDLEFLSTSVNTSEYARSNKLSIETAGRRLRLASLKDMAGRSGCKMIVTAHQADDNAETILHRLLRGTGFEGLCGIWPVKVFADGTVFARPMLCADRRQIIEYCTDNALSWRHDHTNDECTYTRNRIRHLLLPEIQKYCKEPVAETLNELSGKCRRLWQQVISQADTVQRQAVIESSKTTAALDAEVFSVQFPLVKLELIKCALGSIGCGMAGVSQYHYNHIIALAEGQTGRKIELADGFLATAERGRIVFCSQEQGNDHFSDKQLCLEAGKTAQFAGRLIETKLLDAQDCNIEKFKREKTPFVEWFDYDRLAMPLTVRKRREGDRFHPLGRGGPKKVGKFLTDRRISSAERRKVLVIADSEKIVWLAPLRASELTKITPKTRRILQVKIG